MVTSSADDLQRIKTGAMERRFSLIKAGVIASSRLALASAGSLFSQPAERHERRRAALRRQSEYFVDEVGKLKGSVVKIGQMMALYGEHLLPAEVTQALHRLHDSTATLAWPAMDQILRAELLQVYDELEVDSHPLGAASLGQVHRARRRRDGRELCLKIQYPGVAEAIDSDLDLVTRLMRLSQLMPQTREFDEWLQEVRTMMHREVNYPLERETTRRFHDLLAQDERYIVPQVFPEYCSEHVLCTSYEPGFSVNDPRVAALPQERRNRLGMAALELCAQEVFTWGEMQTDPNFGNYLIRIAPEGEHDRIVCLDFGAVRDFPEPLIRLARALTAAAFDHDLPAMLHAMHGFSFFDQLSLATRERLAALLFLAIEPFADPASIEAQYFDENGDYCWARSQLHSRAMSVAARTATHFEFTAPPKELMFVSRKLMGAYTFMTVLDARTQARPMLAHYLQHFRVSSS